jgi:hypothetical protein
MPLGSPTKFIAGVCTYATDQFRDEKAVRAVVQEIGLKKAAGR